MRPSESRLSFASSETVPGPEPCRASRLACDASPIQYRERHAGVAEGDSAAPRGCCASMAAPRLLARFESQHVAAAKIHE